ncbi:hypothetical protein F4803DRAFT_514516 [Xylaria telfairii]|nr:hypothetical protein F4803DRAFT_514516 [Xylaria telfairii]
MEKLSADIFKHIISLLPQRIGEEDVPVQQHGTLPRVLPALATVSRRFQYEIERRTFRTLYINTNSSELSEFEHILNSERRSYVQHLSITLTQPPGPSKTTEDERWYETEQDRQARREDLTAPLRRLWNFINTWDEGASKGIYLGLTAYSSPCARQDSYYPQFGFSLLDLTADAENFPLLPCVRHFDIDSLTCNWNPRVALVLTSRMPKLERAQWGLDEAMYDWGRYYSIDKWCRDELVRSTQTMCLPPSVKKFSCRLKAPNYFCENRQALPRFIKDGEHDPMSCAIRGLTRHCTEVSLAGPFHSSLFDPPRSGPAAEQQPCWQHTSILSVKMLPCSPDGSWLFRPESPGDVLDLPEGLIDCTQLPPGYVDTEEGLEEAEDYYDDHQEIVTPPKKYEFDMPKLVPDDEKLNAMIVAFARCCARMPALKIADLRFEDNNEDFPYQIICIAPFHRIDCWEAEMANPADSYRMYLHFNDWLPTDATITELKNVGVETIGQPSTICYLEWGDFYD